MYYSMKSPFACQCKCEMRLNTPKKVLNYLRKLRSFIQKQRRIILKLNAKIKINKNQKSTPEKSIEVAHKNHEEERKQIVSSYLDDIKQAATDNYIRQQGFQYEPTSGLWYDSKTGYYFNPEYNLYYDGNNGCYLKYNEQTYEYEFHSQVATQASTSKDSDKEAKESTEKSCTRNKSNRRNRRRRKRNKSYSDEDKKEDKEDGELSRSETSSSSDKEEIFRLRKDVASKYPPSIRMVITETDLTQLKKGSLFLVTYKGGSLGREGAHDILIPDINVSKTHLKFFYNHKKTQYECQDMGSRNGTIINGDRLSVSKSESNRVPLQHDSVIELGKTKILCHIHKGSTTCSKCEPGLCIQGEPTVAQKEVPAAPILSHKAQLKQIQKRYGLEKEKYVANETQEGSNQPYNDRANQRRKKVGSSCDAEKTETTSLDTSISNKNKGFKLLTKLGWNEGESLGKTSSGILEPVPLVNNDGTRGLGSTGVKIRVPTKMKNKIEILKKTQQRYLEDEK